jgi:hypothetical protein
MNKRRINKMARTKKTESKKQDPSVEQKQEIDKVVAENPEVAEIINHYNECVSRWNNIAAFLAGNAKIDTSVTPEQHVQWLATAYYYDVLFLLDQLQVVKIPDQAELVQENKENEKK